MLNAVFRTPYSLLCNNVNETRIRMMAQMKLRWENQFTYKKSPLQMRQELTLNQHPKHFGGEKKISSVSSKKRTKWL